MDYNYECYQRMGMSPPSKTLLADLYDPLFRPPAASRLWSEEGRDLLEVPGFGAVLFITRGDELVCVSYTPDEIKPVLHDKE